jgi:hypothetical protein
VPVTAYMVLRRVFIVGMFGELERVLGGVEEVELKVWERADRKEKGKYKDG